MLNVLFFCLVHAFIIGSNAKVQDPRILPSQGEIWPKAWKETKSSTVYQFDTAKMQYNVTGKNCSKLQMAVQRCEEYLNTLMNITKRKYSHGYSEYTVEGPAENTLKVLKISLTKDCEDLPHFGMEESYNLTISDTSELNSSSIWGIIRGMETFSQLFYLTPDFKKVQINMTSIVDRPNYPHRGLLLNTGSHFLSTANILKTIDAMGMNKMNILHWRIIDDESFPYQSSKFPELSGDGAFHFSMVYTKRDMEMIRDYAKNLGIRIVLEFNIPGHSFSMGQSHPEILTDCQVKRAYAPPMNPIKNETYTFLSELFKEVQKLFPDSYIHFGGDDFEVECWEENKDIKKYMQKNNLTSYQLLAKFYEKIFSLLKNDTVPIVWYDVFIANVSLPKNTLVQTWNSLAPFSIVGILKEGYRGIQSAPFFLNELNHDVDWLYRQEPRLAIDSVLNDEKLLQNLVGATACMWGETADDTNVLSQTWPRTSAVAEVLWSMTEGRSLDEASIKRIEEHTCRMRRRGVSASPPVGPGFCLV